ncbi:MAG: hypothetical protein RIS79_1921 [Verrucomicrobiota bacterium]|jgi:hypothetical protein
MLMNQHESRTPGVIFTGMWRYKPPHAAVGALLCAGGSILLARLLLLFFQKQDLAPESILTALALFLAGSLLFYIGTTLFFSLVTGYAKRLVISEEGVRYANAWFSWRHVRWIDARLKGGAYQVFIRRSCGLFRQRLLKIDDGLSEEQRERLLNQLTDRVKPRYGHLRIGDAAHFVVQDRELPAPGAVRTP